MGIGLEIKIQLLLERSSQSIARYPVNTRLFSQAAIYALSNFSVALIPFLLIPVLTRLLTPEHLGAIAVFSVVLSTFVVVIGMNLQSALTVRFFDRREFDTKRYASTCLWLMLISGLFFLVVTSVFAKQLESFSAIPAHWFIIALSVAAVQVVVLLLLAILQAHKNPLAYGGIRFSQALLEAGLSLLLVVTLAWSWHGRLWAIAISTWLVGACALLVLVRKGWFNGRFDPSSAKDALWYALPLMPHSLGGLLLGMADRFLVAYYLDLTRAGLYFVAVQTGLVIGVAADAFNRAYAPWLMEKLSINDQIRDIRIVKWTYVYFVAIILIAFAAGWLLPMLFSWLVGAQFQEAAPIARYMLLGNAFTGMYYMITNYIFFSGHTGRLSILTISVSLVNLLLMSYLLRIDGLEGAAAAFMIGQAVLFFATWTLSSFSRPMPWLPWRWKQVIRIHNGKSKLT